LGSDLKMRIKSIQDTLPQVEVFEAERKKKVVARLENAFTEFVNNETVDKNRFEQESVYFLEIMDKKDVQKGRKLSFVAQEIGREINTIGSKASNAEMQKIVVNMKNELEKIKEQLLNIL